MVKRGKLSKIEKYYIEGNTDLPVEEVAAELDRSVNAVQKHMDTISIEADPEPTQEQPSTKTDRDETQMFKVMGRHERAGEKVATVMTKAASELSDATRPKRIMTKKLQEAIHKPFDGK